MKLNPITAAALLLAPSMASAQVVDQAYNYIEGRIGVADLDVNVLGTELPSDGLGGGFSLRLPIEGNFFASLDGYMGDTDGRTGGISYDLEAKEIRAGFGAVNLTLEGKAAVAVRVEYVRYDVDVSSPGLGSEDDTEEGAGAHIRLESIRNDVRILPYFEAGFVTLSNADGPEVTGGIRIRLEPFQTFIEYRYSKIDADSDLEFDYSRISAGARFDF